jgi:class 3 adenylate cyclase
VNRELPTGTVTFLFTDIEGSTRLLNELGDAYADALAEHRRVLREAFAGHGGVEVDTQGDAFFVAFSRASDALAAAAQAQRVLEGPIKVAPTPASRSSPRRATSASTSTVRRGSRPRVTAARCSSARRLMTWPATACAISASTA